MSISVSNRMTFCSNISARGFPYCLCIIYIETGGSGVKVDITIVQLCTNANLYITIIYSYVHTQNIPHNQNIASIKLTLPLHILQPEYSTPLRYHPHHRLSGWYFLLSSYESGSQSLSFKFWASL